MNSKYIRYTLIVLVIVAGVYAVTNHQEHLASYLPFAFLLGCLFMHLFMHHGHHGHDHNEKEKHES